MTYDAVLVARRGFSPAEFRLARPQLLHAVRWALFAEKLSADLPEMRAIVATDPPDGLAGQDRTNFMAARTEMRAVLAERERVLYPEDEDG